MNKKLSIGTWAYIFNQEKPTNDFHEILHKLQHLGYEGVELGGFNPHPGPDTCETKAKRQTLAKEVKDHGLEFSAWPPTCGRRSCWSVEDSGPFIAAFAKNLFFAEDLGIDTIRVDTVEAVTEVPKMNVTEKLRRTVIFDRVVKAFDLCAKLAASRGIRICWEFEPGFPLNKPSEILDAGATPSATSWATPTSACSTTPATPTCAPSSGPTSSARRKRCPAASWNCWRSSRARSPTST